MKTDFKTLPKIISLVPSITEIVYYLGLEKQLVGVTEHCNYPEDAKNKYKIGTFANPELTKILSINPDIVLANKEVHKKIINELEKDSIEVFAFSNSTLEEIFDIMNEIGEACGSKKCTQPFVDSLKNRVQNLSESYQYKKPRVLRLMNTNPYITPGIGSFQYDALRLAGAQLMDFKSNDSYVKITMTQIKEFDPEIILFCGVEKQQSFKPRCKGCNMEKPICQRTVDDILDKEWRNITAVKEGRVYPISCDILCRPGPRLVNGMEKLFKLFNNHKTEESK